MFQILVVEDDRALCQSVCAYLNSQGFETTGCQRAQDAYDAMYSHVFDLIVSDVMMPGIVIGVLGMIVMGMAYPLYARVIKKERARVAPEILRLSGELLR